MRTPERLAPPPGSDAEWARLVERRLRGLESSRTIRIGGWVITDTDDGLTAFKPGSAPVPLRGGGVAGPDDERDGGRSQGNTGIPSEMPAAWWGALSDALTTGQTTNPALGNVVDYLDAWAAAGKTVPASSIVADSALNLLWNPGFDGDNAISSSGDWTRDTAVYVSSGTSSTSSAKLVIDGRLHIMRSNPINVVEGRHLSFKVELASAGLVATGNAIQVGIIPYDADNRRGAFVPVVSMADMTATPAGWTGLPPGAKMRTVTGSYAVSSGVKRLCLAIVVNPTATAGTLWGDEADATTDGLIDQTLVDGLVGDFQQVNADHAELTNAVRTGADGSDAAESTTGQANEAVGALRDRLVGLRQDVDALTTVKRPGGQMYTAQGGRDADDWNPFTVRGATAAASRSAAGFGWKAAGNSPRELIGVFPSAANSDATMVTVTLRSVANGDWFNPALAGSSMVLIRCNTIGTDFVGVRMRALDSLLVARVNGVETVLKSGGPRPAAADNWSVYVLGTQYTVFRNGEMVWQVNYTGIPADAAHRYAGIGGASVAGSLGEWVPGVISMWLFRDAAPIAVKGSGAYILGRSTGNTGTTANQSGDLYTVRRDIFAVDALWQTDDILMSPFQTGWDYPMTFQVTEEGWYVVAVGIFSYDTNSTITQTGVRHTDADYNNPRWYNSGWFPMYSLSSPANTYGNTATGMWMLYAKEGDTFSPAMMWTPTRYVLGDDSGKTYFGITRWKDAAT